jgi:hypothetical protein
MKCDFYVPRYYSSFHDPTWAMVYHEKDFNHFGWEDVVINPKEWKNPIETVEGSCQI